VFIRRPERLQFVGRGDVGPQGAETLVPAFHGIVLRPFGQALQIDLSKACREESDGPEGFTCARFKE
jgi:hypothetical protein